MKNTLSIKCLTGIIIFMLTTALTQSRAQAGFSITGHIKGIPAGGIKLVSYRDDELGKRIDSVPITNGTFLITGKLPSPEFVGLKIMPGHWLYTFLLENKDISLKIDTTGAEHYDYSSYGMGKGANLNKVVISGSPAETDYERYKNDPEVAKYNVVYAKFRKKYDAEKDEDKREKMGAVGDSIRALIDTREKHLLDSSITANPSSVGVMYSYSEYYDLHFLMPLKELDATLARFKGEATQTIYYSHLKSESTKRHALLPGNIAPDFTLLQRDSSKFTLSSTRGKYVMIDFWASWCHPCRQAIPHWKEIYARYHDRGFDIVSVSDDSRRKDWLAAMDAEKMPWIQVDDEFPVKYSPARVGTLYETHFIPFYVLLDKEGKILVYTDDEKDIDGKLAELLGK